MNEVIKRKEAAIAKESSWLWTLNFSPLWTAGNISYFGESYCPQHHFTPLLIMFGKMILNSLCKYLRMWLLLREISMWTIWVEKNYYDQNHIGLKTHVTNYLARKCEDCFGYLKPSRVWKILWQWRGHGHIVGVNNLPYYLSNSNLSTLINYVYSLRQPNIYFIAQKHTRPPGPRKKTQGNSLGYIGWNDKTWAKFQKGTQQLEYD